MNNNYITITEVNRYIKEIINEDLLLRKVYLKGEISNFKNHISFETNNGTISYCDNIDDAIRFAIKKNNELYQLN